MTKLKRRHMLGAVCSVAAFPSLLVAQTAQPQAPTGFSVNGSSTTAKVATGGIKWHPGHYMQDNDFTTLGNPKLTLKQNQITLLRAGPTQVLGWLGWYDWRTLENSAAGAYDFSTIDIDYVQVTTGSTTWQPGQAFPGYNNPRRFGLKVEFQDPFNGTDPTGRMLPDYVYNSSTYGAGSAGGNGYWAYQYGNGCVAAYWRTAVLNRLLALYTALGAHVLPDGYTLDTSPYVEVIMPYEETVDEPSPNSAGNAWTDPTASNAAVDTAYNAINATLHTAFPHTILAIPNNFYADSGNSAGGTRSVTFENSLPNYPAAASGPDTFTIGNFTNGQLAYQGMLPNPASGFGSWNAGGKNLLGTIPYVASVEGGDYTGGGFSGSGSAAQLFQAMQSLGTTHAYWSYQDSGVNPTTTNFWLGSASSLSNWSAGGDSAVGVLTTIVKSTLSRTSCPSAFGTCNTK